MNKLYKQKIKLYDKKSIPVGQPPPPPIINLEHYEHFEYQPIGIEILKAEEPFKYFEFTNCIVNQYLSLL